MGVPSSHLRWRDLQVKQPVRTRLGLAAAEAASATSPGLLSDPFMEPGLSPMVLELLDDFFAQPLVVVDFNFGLATLPSVTPGVNKAVSAACRDCSAVICIPASPCVANLISSNEVIGSP